MRGATGSLWGSLWVIRISTHAPRAGSDKSSSAAYCIIDTFQPTLPVRGATSVPVPIIRVSEFQPTLPVRGATFPVVPRKTWCRFQPTLPVRGATPYTIVRDGHRVISTHAPRAGSDSFGKYYAPHPLYFNPRSPCGERLCILFWFQWQEHFNPRSPCGERLRN